jgi:hypothetical protein
MRITVTITESIIENVKELRGKYSQRFIANRFKISQYSVWCILNGKYDTKEPLQIKPFQIIHQ